jgi:hypothetical protein
LVSMNSWIVCKSLEICAWIFVSFLIVKLASHQETRRTGAKPGTRKFFDHQNPAHSVALGL